MNYFLTNFADRIAATGVVVLLTMVAAALVWRRTRRHGGEVGTRVARVGAAGFALAALAATTSGIGDGQWASGESLNAWRTDLARFPETVQSVLLVGNVIVYVPVGICTAMGWPRRPVLGLLVALCVPAAVELLQGFALRGVASTDDFILNALGVALGWSVGAVAKLIFRKAGASRRERAQVA